MPPAAEITRLLVGSPAAYRGRLSGSSAALLGAAAHVVQGSLFAAFSNWPMAAFNVLSVGVFLYAHRLFRRGRLLTAMSWISVEVVLHQTFAVLLCGWAPGFQYFLATLPLALSLPGPRTLGVASTAAAILGFIGLAIVAPAHPPAPFPPVVERILGVANPLMAFSVIWIYLLLYRRRADDVDAALAAAMERSDTLLRAILPKSLIERLRDQPTRVAESYPEVTILFADIVGFTPLAQRIAPEALVALLDELFAGFDALVAEHGCEKIKTIGDAYMVAAGAPEPRSDHAVAIAGLALAIRASTAAFAQRTGHPLSLRIGIHSGAVVAGVIGRTKLAFDLWGDTVNTAARMESHSEPGRIQISDATARRLQGHFTIEPRGAIEIKGKGRMDTAWLVSEDPAPAPPRTAAPPSP